MLNIEDSFTDNSIIGIIEPHPDDACLSCIHLIRKYYTKLPIYLYTLSLGESAYGYADHNLAKIRSTETAKFVKKFNLRHIQFDLPDGGIAEHFQDERNYLIHSIKKNKITDLFIPSKVDKHPDHRAVSDIVNALYCSVYEYDSTTALPEFTHYLAVTRTDDYSMVLEPTESLIECYESQAKLCPTFVTGFTGLAKYRGMQVSAYNDKVIEAEVFNKVH